MATASIKCQSMSSISCSTVDCDIWYKQRSLSGTNCSVYLTKTFVVETLYYCNLATVCHVKCSTSLLTCLVMHCMTGTSTHSESGTPHRLRARPRGGGGARFHFQVVWLARPSQMVNAGGADGKGRSSVHSD